jgi:hypothetical protein
MGNQDLTMINTKTNYRALLFVFVLSACSITSFAQSSSIDHSNECYMTLLPKEKLIQENTIIKTISEKPISLKSAGIEVLEKDFQYFYIEGTDSMLVVKSQEFLRRENELSK